MEENIHKKEQNGLIFPDLNVQYALALKFYKKYIDLLK
jgi:hypothetical protein